MASGPRKNKMKPSKHEPLLADASVIYSNPSGSGPSTPVENVYKKVLKDPTYKPPKGGTFNVNKMKEV